MAFGKAQVRLENLSHGVGVLVFACEPGKVGLSLIRQILAIALNNAPELIWRKRVEGEPRHGQI